MIKIENVDVVGFEPAIRGMRNPMNSWPKSDSGICKGGDNGIGCKNCISNKYGNGCDHSYDHSFQVGIEDYRLMMSLSNGGPVHAKYRRYIVVYHDITAPLYWWKEFDTSRVGVCPNPTDIEINSCSTMHKIHEKEFTLDDFSHEHLIDDELFDCMHGDMTRSNLKMTSLRLILLTINMLNCYRSAFLETGDKKYWWQMIQLLPSSYNQKRTIKLNYEVLANAHPMRKDHKLDEWQEYCQWIKTLPCSKVITG